ncbi:beta-galactosidase [Mangrovibacterium marinum]|uniref:beta-galactosidase n=1 Tax=Mangrovibacterium marinum TaxID=1639118 RepID=UPI002A18E1D6|nr:beta-galactosidase [Mangrovibacterium marinum]
MRGVIIFLFCIWGFTANAQYRFDNILYGAAYYSEYMPSERLDEDIKMMKEAGVTIVRVGESTWSLFEPQEGVFEFAWMDRILDKMHEAGIKVILGTPTYSIPAWMATKYPEVLAEHTNGGKAYYGIRQNMDITNPTYLFFSERIVRKMMEHFAKHPAIIGYQVDNEVEARGINNRDYFIGFRNYIKDKFEGSLPLLNKEWGLNYWGMNINTWEDFYQRDGVTNPSYKNEWERYNRKRLAEFLNWQCDIVNEYKGNDQFVTHCFMPYFHNIDQVESFRQMQYPAINIYHDVQDKQNGQWIAYSGDYMRTVAKGNYIVTETNAQAIGWSCRHQHPPYDGQLRQNVYAHLASGANMVSYWHWHSLHYGQETYWRGILGQDLKPNRVYKEFASTAKELKSIGADLVNLSKDNKVAILYSHDSYHAMKFMPYTDKKHYPVEMIHSALYNQNIESDIVPCDQWTDFSKYKMLVIPPLYVATDSLLEKIDKFVKGGGYVVMLYKSGYCNEHSAVRATLAPGPLRKACGFYYQEYANIPDLPLKDNAFGLSGNQISDWYEFLIPETAKPLAYADHPFYGKWPVITENDYGKGKLIYVGTYPSLELLEKIILKTAKDAGLISSINDYRFPIIMRSGRNESGKTVHYVFNYSAGSMIINNPYPDCKELISGKTIGNEIKLAPWDVKIICEQ